MPMYRKRPVVIEAVQFDGSLQSADRISAWVMTETNTPITINTARTLEHFELGIPTLEGVMKAVAGDFVIRGVAGEFYPCKPDIFAATYEEVV